MVRLKTRKRKKTMESERARRVVDTVIETSNLKHPILIDTLREEKAKTLKIYLML